MKRFYLWIAVLLSACILCGCQESGNPNIYDVTYNGKNYTVDQEQGTVTCDKVVYQFEISSRGGNSVDLDIIYPDGSRYYWTKESYGGHGGWSDNYDPEGKGYVPGDVLWDVLGMRSDNRKDSDPSPLLAFLLLAAGAFQTITPQTAWMLEHGWRFKNAEPSDLALSVNRILGVVLIFIGAICLLASVL